MVHSVEDAIVPTRRWLLWSSFTGGDSVPTNRVSIRIPLAALYHFRGSDPTVKSALVGLLF